MRNVTFPFTSLVTISISVTITIAAVTLHPSDARACSPGQASGVSPADGAVDVPTNASLFFAPAETPSTAFLVDELTGERSELVVNLDAPVTEAVLPNLAPSTPYRVELDLFENDSGVLEPTRELRFTTAAGADEEEPAIGDVESDVTVEKVPGGLTFGEGCALAPLPYWRADRVNTKVIFTLEVAPDTAFVRLFRTLDGERVAAGATFNTPGSTSLEIADFTSEVGEATYTLVAVDAAGNTSSELVEQSLGQLAGGCSQAGASTAAPIVAALLLLRGGRRSLRSLLRSLRSLRSLRRAR